MSAELKEGLVLRVTGHEVWVESGGRTLFCHLRGRFRKKARNFQVVAGDRVELIEPGAGAEHGTIEAIAERSSWLSRWVGGRVSAERVIVANVDRLLYVVTPLDPRLNLQFVDRVLVSAARGHTPATIILNKMDLLENPGDVDGFIETYQRIGYAVLPVSAERNEGLEAVEALLDHGVYAFVGQSGVGKSSILNRIDPDLDLKVSHVAEKTGRGRHTTTYSQLFPFRAGYVADTPGMQTFGFPGSDKTELSECFPEFAEYVPDCRFQPCTHSHEPGCAVKAALEDGAIAESRYKSYLAMLAEIDEREKDKKY